MIKEMIVAAAMAATPLDCLSLNIYHEARGESKLGQIAVGHVTLNRVKSKLYPSKILRLLSAKIMKGVYKDPTFGAMYFHTKQIRPRWMNRVKRTVTIGNHIFYKR
jgi:spore germination cell wall hydrolase CwlJ-like protein